MSSSRRSRPSDGVDRPSKKTRVTAAVAESGEDETKTWQQVALDSKALRKTQGLGPTGPLDPIKENRYLSYLPYKISSVVNNIRGDMSGTQDYNWPVQFHHWTAAETMRAIRFGVALAEEDIALEGMVPGTKEFATAKAIAKQHFQLLREGPARDPVLARAAFERGEMPDDEGAHPSRRLRERLFKYAAEYYGCRTGRFHAPYTSMVGPSGSGKTFAVKHLAEEEDVWVVYTSLSRTRFSVPAPGSIGSLVQSIISEDAAKTLWDRYIRVGKLLVAVARDRRISPGMLFRMQYHHNFVSFREDIANLQWEATRSKRPADPSWDAAASNMLVFCIDEARGLLHVPADDTTAVVADAAPPVAFRELRHELRLNGYKGKMRLFGLLLDTSSRVQNFVPSAAYGPSIKVGVSTELFPPLYGIHAAWDGIANRSRAVQDWLRTVIVSNGTTTTVQAAPQATEEWYRFFYSLGRPLWGAILEAGAPTADEEDDGGSTRWGITTVRDLVYVKLKAKRTILADTEKDHYHMALLLFRLPFNVSDHKLSEACVADWMHYVRTISADRTTVQTVQPGEPVLAQHVAVRMQESPAFREEMVASLMRSLHYGALNVGDSGEIIAGLLLLLAVDSMPEEKENQVRPLHRSLAEFLHIFSGWTTMPKHAAQARIHVTHLGRLCTPSSVTQKHLCAAFLTGEAWFLSANFAGADLLVPVWQGPGQPMTALLMQVKNRHGPREITPAILKEARASLGAGRGLIEALRDEELPVYGLVLNLRPLAKGAGAHEPSRASECSEGSLTAYVRTGCSEATLGFLTPRLYEMLYGVVGAHGTGVLGEDQHGLTTMLQTRDGSTFWENASAAEDDAMDL